MKAFFEKLTGGPSDDEPTGIRFDRLDDEQDTEEWLEPEVDEELAVDVYQDQDNIYIKAFIPGVTPNSLDVDISRDVVTIRGQRFKETGVEDEDYFQKELTWGAFSRKILLPREVDIDEAEAHSSEGLVTLLLPKIDKDKKAKLRVKASR